MAYENLDIKTRKGIITLTINREKALNALNGQTMEELAHFFTVSVPRRKSLKGIIITGAGPKAFVAGADIKEFLNVKKNEGASFAQKGQEVFLGIENCPLPVIAAVNGFALGGGCELAMACHMRVAGTNARFGQPEVNLGIIPGYGGTQRLVQLVGKGKAMELILTGDMIDAQEAYKLGLVNHVTEAGKEVAKAREIIEKIATKGPIAVTNAINCVNAYFDKLVDGFAYEVNQFGETTNSKDFRIGAKAFIDRKPAKFTGK